MQDFSSIISKTNFTIYDWVIVAVYLSISLGVGVMVRKYITNMDSYLAAGRAIGTRLGIATMAGTEMGDLHSAH